MSFLWKKESIFLSQLWYPVRITLVLGLVLSIINLKYLKQMAKTPLGTTRKTGEKCPESGVWESQSTPSTTIPLTEGEKFPPYNGEAVTWKLIRYA